jgi:hypothetical protein
VGGSDTPSRLPSRRDLQPSARDKPHPLQACSPTFHNNVMPISPTSSSQPAVISQILPYQPNLVGTPSIAAPNSCQIDCTCLTCSSFSQLVLLCLDEPSAKQPLPRFTLSVQIDPRLSCEDTFLISHLSKLDHLSADINQALQRHIAFLKALSLLNKLN